MGLGAFEFDYRIQPRIQGAVEFDFQIIEFCEFCGRNYSLRTDHHAGVGYKQELNSSETSCDKIER